MSGLLADSSDSEQIWPRDICRGVKIAWTEHLNAVLPKLNLIKVSLGNPVIPQDSTVARLELDSNQIYIQHVKDPHGICNTHYWIQDSNFP